MKENLQLLAIFTVIILITGVINKNICCIEILVVIGIFAFLWTMVKYIANEEKTDWKTEQENQKKELQDELENYKRLKKLEEEKKNQKGC